MKKIIFLTSLCFLVCLRGFAQYGNEWISFGQPYYKITVAEDGMYRLSYSSLQAAGFPVNSVDPRAFQIFHRGEEQAIYVEGEQDGVFNSSDYIEFYGQRNEGTLDADLYEDPSYQVNPYYNLYSDERAYFLTYKTGTLGKRMINFNEINVTNIPPDTYHFDEKLIRLSNSYAVGYTENSYLQTSSFGEAEGWSGAMIRNSQSLDYIFQNVSNYTVAGGQPELELALIGLGTMAHQVEIYVGASTTSLRLLTTVSFQGFTKQVVQELLQSSDIGTSGQFYVRIATIGLNGESDRVSVPYLILRYAQTYGVAVPTEKVYQVKENVSNKSFIRVSSYPSGAKLYDVTNPSALVRIRTLQNATLDAVIPNTNMERKILLTNRFLSASIEKIFFRQLDAQSAFVIISHKSLMKPAYPYSDPVRAYAGYRASVEGGGYDTLVVDIEQLFNQFNYGEPSPRAIRKFMEYLINTQVPDYLFLIGKGLDVNFNYYRNPNNYAPYHCLVPSAGLPASDMLFTTGLGGTTHEPAVPTGRITALNAEEVAIYLNKVKEMESVSYDGLWRKDILHLSGGIRGDEPKLFKAYMKGFEEVAEDVYLGGLVKTISKETTNVELVNVSDEVNKGLNLITFFGHAAPGVIDFDVGFASDPSLGYNNKGKYPIFLINGCNAGSFFLNSTLFGEDWVNTPNKGAIGFIAHTSFGLAYTLRRYTDYFYAIGYGDPAFISQGIGDIQKEVVRQYMETAPATTSHLAQVHQMLLLGDPAVKLFGASNTDYAIRTGSLSIKSVDEQPITALSDEFMLQMTVDNFGVTDGNPLHIRVTRTLFDGTVIEYDSLYAEVLYSDTLSFRITNEQGGDAGYNLFVIEIDPNNNIIELSKENNIDSLEFFIPLNRTKNLYPYDYAIVTQTDVQLRFQTTDLFSETRNFMVEVDTAYSFDSPLKKAYTVSGKVLAIQAITLLGQDSLVYYWRTKLADPLPGESEEWTLSSFSFINDGVPGWAQIHFPQYLKNEWEGLVPNLNSKKFGFEETETSVEITNYGIDVGADPLDVSIQIDGAEYQLPSTYTNYRRPCRDQTINLIAFDRVTTVPYSPISLGLSDARTCGKAPQVISSYLVSELESSFGIYDYIDGIEAGDSVVLFSIGNAGFSSWSAGVKSKLAELGISSAQIEALEDGEPVVIFARKAGDPASALVYTSSTEPEQSQQLSISKTITGRYTYGNMTSVLMGPASAWQQLDYRTEALEPDDNIQVNLYGVTLSNEETLLLADVNENTDLSAIAAHEYPQLKLNYYTQDDVELTASQLERWIVAYTPVAEGIVFYQGTTNPISLVEGQSWSGVFGFTNISERMFPDSLPVHLEVFNKVTYTTEIKMIKIKSPDPGDTTYFDFNVNTTGKGGSNNIGVFVNPREVPEQYYDNNIIELGDYLHVQVDEFNPVLDVTIDGRQVMDGDFVSPNPEISLRIWDDNQFLLKQDTLGVSMFLKYPCSSDTCGYTPIFFSREEVSWTPATDASDFNMTFRPIDLPDGIYTLRIQAGDSKGNQSTSPYEVTFWVSRASSLLFLAPRPNPSNEVFTFTFVFSGEIPPDDLSIDILSVNGQQVDRLALQGDFHIGTNEIYWNGTYENGNQVPSGIYLYHINLYQQGQVQSVTIPLDAGYYTGGYGKLVLIR